MRKINRLTYIHCETDYEQERKEKEKRFKKDFGESLAIYLNKNKIKHEELAKSIGYDRQHIYGICSGKKAPSIFCLWRILDYLNITYEVLMGYQLNNKYLDSDKAIVVDKIKKINSKNSIDYIGIGIEYVLLMEKEVENKKLKM